MDNIVVNVLCEIMADSDIGYDSDSEAPQKGTQQQRQLNVQPLLVSKSLFESGVVYTSNRHVRAQPMAC
jgi:hypothetical protein